jgi:hypothetical protein
LPDALAAPPREACAADFRAEDFPAAICLAEAFRVDCLAEALAFRADFAPPCDDFAPPFEDFAPPLPPLLDAEALTAARDTDPEARDAVPETRLATLPAVFDALRATLPADFDA